MPYAKDPGKLASPGETRVRGVGGIVVGVR